ncbi:UNVERIFIED_CONTAM: hypothetical protein Sradi_1742600 [Sesamum radiatum]|uniref:MULE transposase domain-containing protein n=1 Tax=Sesamum radiatum TaxID=300843 RepID=A0AAW2TV02_SESRA
MVLDDFADFDVWVGGVIEWVPRIRYVGGIRVWFPNVDRERLYYGDLLDMYVKAGGKGLNVVIYFCLPGHTLENGIRMLNGDEGIRELLLTFKGLSVIPIYFEEKQGPLLVVDSQGNVLSQDEQIPYLPYNAPNTHDATNAPEIDEATNAPYIDENNPSPIHNPIPTSPLFEGAETSFTEEGEGGDCAEDGERGFEGAENYERDGEGAENGEGGFQWGFEGVENGEGGSSSSDSTASQCPSWLLEDLEGPLDDDIFEHRPPDHTRKLFKAIRSFVREQRKKKKAEEEQRQEDERNLRGEGWFSDASVEDDIESLRGSDNEDPCFPVWNERMNFDNEELSVGMKFPTREKYREVLRDWAVRRGWDLKFQHNETKKITATLCKYNPGSTLVLKVDRDLSPPVLQRMYYCLSGLREGFLNGWMEMIIYPIAMAYVEIEKFDSWEWFLKLLLRDIGSAEERGWAFISDRQKGLLEAVSSLAPNAEHRFCLRHMYNNFKAKFKGQQLKKLFWKAASTYNVKQHLRVMKEIERVSPKVGSVQTAFEWLSEVPVHHWARCFFPARTKCDTLVNNMSESFNSYILEAREQPIIDMFETIRKKCMTRIQIKKAGMEKYDKDVCPNICKKIERQRQESRHCFPSWAVYNHMINPVPGMHDFEESPLGKVAPPSVKSKVGRPKKHPNVPTNGSGTSHAAEIPSNAAINLNEIPACNNQTGLSQNEHIFPFSEMPQTSQFMTSSQGSQSRTNEIPQASQFMTSSQGSQSKTNEMPSIFHKLRRPSFTQPTTSRPRFVPPRSSQFTSPLEIPLQPAQISTATQPPSNSNAQMHQSLQPSDRPVQQAPKRRKQSAPVSKTTKMQKIGEGSSINSSFQRQSGSYTRPTLSSQLKSIFTSYRPGTVSNSSKTQEASGKRD